MGKSRLILLLIFVSVASSASEEPIADAEPLSAVGTGGQRLRKGAEPTNAYFNLVFEYPGGLAASVASRQCGKGPGGIFCTMYGTRGAVETQYGGNVKVHGDAPYAGGSTGSIFQAGVVTNIATFHESVTAGRCDNPTVAPSVRSNLTTVLGRTAAYTGEKVTWAEMMKANAKLEADLKGLKA